MKKNKIKVAILVANNFQESETIIPYNILQAANFCVDLVGIDDSLNYKGVWDLKIEANKKLSDVFEDNYDCVIIPGGAGHEHIKNCTQAKKFVERHNKDKKLIAAICAGPTVLGDWKLLKKHKATCYPKCKENFIYNIQEFINTKVVISDNIITSQGPGTSFNFAIAIIKKLSDDKTVHSVMNDALISL